MTDGATFRQYRTIRRDHCSRGYIATEEEVSRHPALGPGQDKIDRIRIDIKYHVTGMIADDGFGMCCNIIKDMVDLLASVDCRICL